MAERPLPYLYSTLGCHTICQEQHKRCQHVLRLRVKHRLSLPRSRFSRSMWTKQGSVPSQSWTAPHARSPVEAGLGAADQSIVRHSAPIQWAP